MREIWFPAIAYVTYTGKGVKIYSINQWTRIINDNNFIGKLDTCM